MKQFVFIFLILGVGVYLGAQILKIEPPQPQEEQAEASQGPEGWIALPEEVAKSAGIVVEPAQKGMIRTTLVLSGKVSPNEEALAHVFPRYSGVVKEVRKRLGESVTKDEVLALIESNESLQGYEMRSPIEGTVIQKHGLVGESVHAESEMFVVADLRTVWVDLNVHRHDFHRMKVGQTVLVDAGDGGKMEESTVAYLSPVGAANSQSMLARVEIPNPNGEWKPGLFVKGFVTLEEAEAPVLIPLSAVQSWEEKDVVFVSKPKGFETRAVTLGRKDFQNTEVLLGLKAGESVAVQNSFVLKSELGKSEAGCED